MSKPELPNLRGVGDCLIADVAKLSHITNEIFFLIRSHRRCQFLSLEFSESSNRRGMNLAGGPAKINNAPTMVCRPPLLCLVRIESVNLFCFSIKYFPPSLFVAIPSLFMEEDDSLFMESG